MLMFAMIIHQEHSIVQH